MFIYLLIAMFQRPEIDMQSPCNTMYWCNVKSKLSFINHKQTSFHHAACHIIIYLNHIQFTKFGMKTELMLCDESVSICVKWRKTFTIKLGFINMKVHQQHISTRQPLQTEKYNNLLTEIQQDSILILSNNKWLSHI